VDSTSTPPPKKSRFSRQNNTNEWQRVSWFHSSKNNSGGCLKCVSLHEDDGEHFPARDSLPLFFCSSHLAKQIWLRCACASRSLRHDDVRVHIAAVCVGLTSSSGTHVCACFMFLTEETKRSTLLYYMKPKANQLYNIYILY